MSAEYEDLEKGRIFSTSRHLSLDLKDHTMTIDETPTDLEDHSGKKSDMIMRMEDVV